MGLNWLDVTGNLVVGAIDKNEQYRREELEASMEELKQNKEFYRALATTRYSKDLDRYYTEKEKYDNQVSTYEKIQSANGGKGMSKKSAAYNIIMSDSELSKLWIAAGDSKYGQRTRNDLLSQVMSGFKDTMGQIKVGEKAVGPGGQEKEDIMKEGVTGWEFSHPELNIQAPKKADYYKGDEFWTGLRKEIESESQGPLTKEFIKLFGWKNKDKSEAAADMVDSIEDIKGTEIKEMIMADGKSVPKKYSSSNVSTQMDDLTQKLPEDQWWYIDSDDVPSVLKSIKNSYTGALTNDAKKKILSEFAVMSDKSLSFYGDMVQGEFNINPNGQYIINKMENIFKDIEDQMWNTMLATNDRRYYSESVLSKAYAAEVKNRSIALDNISMWEANEEIEGFLILPTDIMPLGAKLSTEEKEGLGKYINSKIEKVDGTIGENQNLLEGLAKEYLVQEKIIEVKDGKVTGWKGGKELEDGVSGIFITKDNKIEVQIPIPTNIEGITILPKIYDIEDFKKIKKQHPTIIFPDKIEKLLKG